MVAEGPSKKLPSAARIPVVSGETHLLNAFARMIRSGSAGVAVADGGKLRIYTAEALYHRLANDRMERPQADVAEVVASAVGIGAKLESSGNWVTLDVTVNPQWHDLALAVGIHNCRGTPPHTYYDWDLATLRKNPNNENERICDLDDEIVD